MPRLVLRTRVRGNPRDIISRFDRELFNYLLPPKWIARVNTFEGSKPGDRVKVEFLFPYKARMDVEIFSEQITDNECWFTDEGHKLPFGLKYWRHKHRFMADGGCCIISDEIEFRASFWLQELFFKMAFRIVFSTRKKKYRAYFGMCQQ